MNIKKVLQSLQKRSIVNEKTIDNVYYKECGYKQGSDLPIVDESWTVFNQDMRWGEYRDTHCWFYFKTTVPSCTRGNEMYLKITTDKNGWDSENPQFLAYVNGKCVQGLDINHTKLYLEEGDAEIYLYAYSGTPSPSGENGKFASSLSVSLTEVNKETEALYHDIFVPFGVMEYLDENTAEYSLLEKLLLNAASYIDDFDDGEVFQQGVRKARAFLKRELYDKDWSADDTVIAGIGHTHIDIAWLWTVAQAREKAQRSFATEVALLKRNDDFYFTSSQAYLYQAVKEECPTLYDEIKEMVKQGKWEVEGAAYVECDTNVPNGESLVRQLLYGKKFFLEEFGKECRVMWLPDVFGYTAALPQILVKSGVDKFVTSKISWNDTNRLPNDMFFWKGIDGTEILTHFISTTPKRKGLPVINGTGYVAQALPSEVAGTYERFCPKEIAGELLYCYGHGDGGGGVTEEMIERMRRMKKGLPGCPVAKMKTVKQAFKDMELKNKGKKLPIWDGELYLEFHRGTYTTKADNKKYNRRCEALLRTAEWLCVTDYILNGAEYPYEQLERLWKTVLLNQFHDILPGSSIKEVYEVTDAEYASVINELNTLIDNKKRRVLPSPRFGEKIVFNSAVTEARGYLDEIAFEKFPSLGYRRIFQKTIQHSISAGEKTLENKFYKVIFNDCGQIESLVYKPLNREVLKTEKANVLMAYRDTPAEYEAWNIDKDYIENAREINSLVEKNIVEINGGKGFRFKWKFGKSEINQAVIMYDGPRIDFITDVDWQEKQVLLKTLFPIDINTSRAVYEIQFGQVDRTTHNNTSWDSAQFEVPAQRYAYLAEKGFGFALLNNCKYGYSAKENVLGLSLLRSTDYPCKNADIGKHSFTYSVVCGESDFEEIVLNEAESLNNPLEIFEEGEAKVSPDAYSLVSLNQPNVLISAVKMAENGKGVVVRIYEALGKRTEVDLTVGFDVRQAYLTDLQEKISKQIKVKERKATLQIKPYEIITLLMETEI